MTPIDHTQLAVVADSSQLEPQAKSIAEQLAITLLPTGSTPEEIELVPIVIRCRDSGLELQQTGAKAPGPVKVDFLAGAVAHRRLYGGGAGQQIAKAVGIKSGVRPRVVDATAGLGRDSFVLATLGCQVTLLERSPVIALLLEDGLKRAAADPEVAPIVANMKLVAGDSIEWLKAQAAVEDEALKPQVVYLDPMFPHRDKSAEIKKEMKVFRQLVGDDSDAEQLLDIAFEAANNRVVVKRPRKAECIANRKPSHQILGKSGRFDVYSFKKLD